MSWGTLHVQQTVKVGRPVPFSRQVGTGHTVWFPWLQDSAMNELLPFGEFAPRERAPQLAPHFLMGLESWELERILHRLNVTNSHSSMAGRARRSRNRSEAVAISGQPSARVCSQHCLPGACQALSISQSKATILAIDRYIRPVAQAKLFKWMLAIVACASNPACLPGFLYLTASAPWRRGPGSRCEAAAFPGGYWWGQLVKLGPGCCVSHQRLSEAQKVGCWQGLTGCTCCIADVATTSSGQHRAHAGSSGREQASSSGAQASAAEQGHGGEPSSDVEQLGEGAFPSSWPPASERSKLPMVSDSALVCCMCMPLMLPCSPGSCIPGNAARR